MAHACPFPARRQIIYLEGGIEGDVYLDAGIVTLTFSIGEIMKRLISVFMLLCVLGVAMPAVVFAAGSADVVAQNAKVSLNAGSAVDLQTLPGIGEVTAERIITFREQNGPFATVDDLIKVKGIGVKTLEKLRPMLEL